MSSRDHLFQLEVLDFHRKNYNPFFSYKDDVISDGNGGRIKLIDTLPIAPLRTLLKRAKSEKIAKKWATRFGSIISCCKVGVEPYYKNIEYLNIKQKPMVEFTVDDFTVNKNLEVSRVRRDSGIIVEIEKPT